MKKHNLTQGTEEWHQMRKGKMSGTVLKSIMGTPKARQEALYEMIAERLTVGVEMDYENPMDRGTRLEPDAITLFELKTGKDVERVGFCEDEDNASIGNSPDGLIGSEEAIEVKCMGGKNHVKMWLTNELPDEYVWQVVQYFIVNPELKTLYFVGYNPDIPIHPTHIIEVKREEIEEKITHAKTQQNIFLKEVETVLSKIITI